MNTKKVVALLWGVVSALSWTRWIVVLLLLYGAYEFGLSGALESASAPPQGGRSQNQAVSTSRPAAGLPASNSQKKKQPATIWTCAMHPQIRMPTPGKCPICGMTLIPLKEEGGPAGNRRLVMSQEARALAHIETSKVTRRFADKLVRLVGMVAYDETRVKQVAAWIPGRLDRLYVDYTGTEVKKGDHMVWLYSPKLLTAQQELIQAVLSIKSTAREKSVFLHQSAQRLLEVSRDKLRLLGLSQAQIQQVEKTGKAEPHVQIDAPISGIVIHKKAFEGMYVKTGTPIYTIADMSTLWVNLDAYESDLPWIRFGQKVEIQAEALPGEHLQGWISFVPPYLDLATRTVKVRVIVKNQHFKFKPGMFVHGIVHTRLAAEGRVMAPDLANKWICPMHHEEVKSGPGTCSICGMDLVKASDLGFKTPDRKAPPPLVIPKSALLLTGRRGVVYVQVPGARKPTFEGREVSVGPRAGDWYVILGGLKEGEDVVTQGQFKIDSALQIRAKKSMMSMPPQRVQKEKDPQEKLFQHRLEPVYQSYFKLHQALTQDDPKTAWKAVAALRKNLLAVEEKLLHKEQRALWHEAAHKMLETTAKREKPPGLKQTRALFVQISKAMIQVEQSFGHPHKTLHYKVFCPMANGGKGAEWLQTSDQVQNPYLGTKMPHCGTIRKHYQGSRP